MSTKLLITGDGQSELSSYLASGAGSVCLDLEDTVPDDRKAATRGLVPSFLAMSRPADCHAAIRLNPLSTRHGLEDILMLMDLAKLPDLVVLTKIEHAAEIHLLDSLLSGRCAAIPFSVIIETPRALANVESIAVASPRITSLSLGGKDLSKANRMARQWEALLYARSRVVNAAALAGIDVFDEPFHPRDDLAALRENCRRVKDLGFTGKSATDPRHAKIINAVFGADLVP